MYLLICSTNIVLILFWDKIYWDNKSKLLLVGEQLRTTLNLIRGRAIAENLLSMQSLLGNNYGKNEWENVPCIGVFIKIIIVISDFCDIT